MRYEDLKVLYILFPWLEQYHLNTQLMFEMYMNLRRIKLYHPPSEKDKDT